MGVEGEKTPDPTPPKSAIKTPPRIPSLPSGETTTAGLNNNRTSNGYETAKPVGLRAAVAKAISADVSPLMKPPRHERGVSWDQTVADNLKMPNSPPTTSQNPLDQPDLSFMEKTANKQGMPPRPPAIAKRGISGNSTGYSRRTLNLEAIADDPFEREAEDVILQSLEERDPMHARSNTGANILAGVPDEIGHNFSLDSDGDGSQVVAPNPARPTLNRPRLTSNDYSKASRLSQRPKHIQQPTHKRQPTVEEALFGLTAALNAVHADEVDQGILPEQGSSKHERNDTATSTDRLAKTAELIFGKKRFLKNRASFASDGGTSTSGDDLSSPKQDGPQLQPSSNNLTSSITSGGGGGARSKWALLKENMENLDKYKKTDIPEEDEGEDLEGIDIETGKNDEDHSNDQKNSTDEETGSGDKGGKNNKKKGRLRISLGPFKHLPYADKIKNEWDLFNNFMAPRKRTMFTYARYIILYIWLPALAAAAILYHFLENPPTGKGPWPEEELAANATRSETEPVEKLENKASVSWWIIFIALRQIGIVVIAKSVEAVVVDFLAIQTRAILRSFGPVITLLFVQSKGWPFLISCWGVLNFVLVTGDSPFNHHWLFWQDLWGLFNENNPSGDVTNTLWFTRVCAIATGLGIAVSTKRVAVGIYLGRQTFANYSDKLAKIMNSMLQVSQVAILAQAIEKKYWAEVDKYNELDSYPQQSTRHFSRDNLMSLIATANEERNEDFSMMDMTHRSANTAEGMGRVIDPDDVDLFTGKLGESQRARIADLLGQWEEPGRGNVKNDHISVGAVLQFRRALASMDTPYPFSGSFGLADTREHCVVSSQAVYERLLLKNQTVNGKLHFDTMAVLALQRNGELDQDRAKELIRTFRPDRDGGISMVDFVRSVDAVYKELRMLRATVAASSKIDKALESIMNIVFYVAMVCIILALYGFDPLALFLSLSSIILAFAFMIGSASAKYFEGLLLILIQRPYGIGDRINVSNPESVTSWTGSQGWIVDDVTLFATTFYMVGTNEMATVSNGSLAKSRIINGARSKRAILLLNLKFGLEVPYKRIEIFKSAVEKFVKARPREWLGLLGIRAGRVEADLGFVEYTIVLQHREAWQNAGLVLDSKHAVHSFMLELTKKLDLRYKSPPLPVLLQYGQSGPIASIESRFVENTTINGNASVPGAENDAPLSPKSIGTSASDDIQAIIHMFEGK